MSDAGKPGVNGANAMRVHAAQRSLVLRARAAADAMRRLASRFMSLRLQPRRTWQSSCQSRAWTPLQLRWARKAVAGRDNGAGRRPAPATWPASQLHWHFHLTVLPGSDRDRLEARTPALTYMNPPGAGSMAGTGYRRLRGPRVRAFPAYPQPSGMGRVEALTNRRGSYERRWLGRPLALRFAQPAHASPEHPFLRRAHLRPGSRPVDQTGTAASNASGDALTMPMEAPAAMISGRRSIHAQAHAGSGTILQQTRSPATRILPWPRRAHPASDMFDSPHLRAVARRQGEQFWRAMDGAATATRSSTHTAAPRAMSGTDMSRPVDLVWLARRATSATRSADSPRVDATSGALAPAAASIQAVADLTAAAGRTSDHTVMRATALDPALANRLADEVIRRIDRRARIERERRGL